MRRDLDFIEIPFDYFTLYSNLPGWVKMKLLLATRGRTPRLKLNISGAYLSACVMSLCVLVFNFFLDGKKNHAHHFLSRHDPYLSNWKKLDCSFSLIWQSYFFFAWLTFNTNSLAMCRRLNHIFSAFDFSFLVMASFKVLEFFLSALNILFLPLITNFSPLPARVFPFANQCDIILHSDLWKQMYAKDLIIVAYLQKESNDLIAINGSCWDQSLKFKSS